MAGAGRWCDTPDYRTGAVPGSCGADDGSPLEDAEGILFALARAVEQRDRQTAGHCERLALLSLAMGVAMRLDRASLLALYRGGYLHDVGKLGIPDSILFKRGKLTPQEWRVMCGHPAQGEEICRHVKGLHPVLPVIRHHHERWDGTGYPDGLEGEHIPLLARVVQIADIYDALTHPRSYKPSFSTESALVVIRDETARGWCDPEVAKAFLKLHQDVGLTNGEPDRSLEALRKTVARLHGPPGPDVYPTGGQVPTSQNGIKGLFHS
jgi:HD-GYP domain-containing protein (c-di-GMP phosphodiesterase class II)